MPSTVLVKVARTEDPIPGSRLNILWGPDPEKEKHARCGRNTAYRY